MHLDDTTRQVVFQVCNDIMASINSLYHIATMRYDAVKRAVDTEAAGKGNLGKWQETDTKFGWWLLDT